MCFQVLNFSLPFLYQSQLLTLADASASARKVGQMGETKFFIFGANHKAAWISSSCPNSYALDAMCVTFMYITHYKLF